jgi:hypothetical protein
MLDAGNDDGIVDGDGGGEKCAAIARHSGRSRNRAHCAASDCGTDDTDGFKIMRTNGVVRKNWLDKSCRDS